MKSITLLAALLVMLTVLRTSAQTTPEAPSSPTVAINNGVVYIEWQINGPVTSFEITPILVQGNAERRLNSAVVYNRFALYGETTLKQTANALTGTSGPAKYRFGIRTLYLTQYSPETKTKTITVK